MSARDPSPSEDDPRPLLGVDVGGTTLRGGLVVAGRVVTEARVRADLSARCRADPEAAERTVRAAVDGVLERLGPGAREARALGLALPAFLERDGPIRLAPNLPGLEGVDLRVGLAADRGLPVHAENDALAAAWGECSLVSDPPANLLYLGLGTGVGSGLILDGRPWRGAAGFAAEIGHLIVEPEGRLCGCGRRGCLETVASATGVAATWTEATGVPAEAPAIAARARDGDAVAVEAFVRAGDALGRATAHVVKTLDLTDLIVGGGLSSAWDLLEPAFLTRVRADVLGVHLDRLRVRASTAGDQAGMLGAAELAGLVTRPRGGGDVR